MIQINTINKEKEINTNLLPDNEKKFTQKLLNKNSNDSCKSDDSLQKSLVK